MRKEKLTIDHQEILYQRLRESGTSVSEFSFANLFLFREAHDYEVVFDREIFIEGTSYDGRRYLMPTSDVRKMDPGYLHEMMKNCEMLYPVPEEWIPAFDPERYSFIIDEGDTDYVFTSEKISSYRGKKLHSKRNLMQQFQDLYENESFPLTGERRDDALKILDEWQKDSGLTEKESDYGPCREALMLQERLLLCGGIYYADSQPAGFILGEGISSDMFALHFAKGLKKFKGIYQFMYNNCAKVLNSHYTYVNFEQDLGKLPLRQAKISYVPDMLLKKYRVSPVE
jgi:uncharacterized protein